MKLGNVSLEDKYTLQSGRVFITGTQALVRLPLMQHLRDRAEGFHTAGYITGYRGSPLGGYDQQLWAAGKLLKEHHVVFNPGVNEDLAATACWGTQQIGFHGVAKYDGAFAIWYGKGPGADRFAPVDSIGAGQRAAPASEPWQTDGTGHPSGCGPDRMDQPRGNQAGGFEPAGQRAGEHG